MFDKLIVNRCGTGKRRLHLSILTLVLCSVSVPQAFGASSGKAPTRIGTVSSSRESSIGGITVSAEAFDMSEAEPAGVDEKIDDFAIGAVVYEASFFKPKLEVTPEILTKLNIFTWHEIFPSTEISYKAQCGEMLNLPVLSPVTLLGSRSQTQTTATVAAGSTQLVGTADDRDLQTRLNTANICSSNRKPKENIDVLDAQKKLKGISRVAAEMDPNGKSFLEDGDLLLSHYVSDNSDSISDIVEEREIAVFNLSNITLEEAKYLEIEAPENSIVLINVSGDGVSMEDTVVETGTTPNSTILWNFYEAENLDFQDTTFAGSILAPLADIYIDGGELGGSIFGRTLDGTVSMTNCRFNGWGHFFSFLPSETMFPERNRGRPMGEAGSDGLYSFESCGSGSPPAAYEATKVYKRDLEKMNFFISVGNPIEETEGDDIFYRVITSNLGNGITITDSNEVSCEDPFLIKDDPKADPITECVLNGWPGINQNIEREDGFAGNIIIADEITIDGTIELDHFSLFLIAKKSITFHHTSQIVGPVIHPPLPKPPQPTIDPVEKTPRVGYQTMWANADRCKDADSAVDMAWCYEFLPTKTFKDETVVYKSSVSPTPGLRGASAGTVMIITPTVMGDTTIDLRGQDGQPGGDAPDFSCPRDDPECLNSVKGKGTNGARGGDGGRGGNLVVISKNNVANIRLINDPGQPGVGGRQSVYIPAAPKHRPADQRIQTLTDNPEKRKHEWVWIQDGELFNLSYGTLPWPLSPGIGGAAGDVGSRGRRYERSLENDYLDLLFLFAKRGAVRLALDGDYHARYTDPAAFEGNHNRLSASYFFQKILDQYCREPIEESKGHFVFEGTRDARMAYCREAEGRLRILRGEANYFGFHDDLVVYITPDVMKEFHERIISSFADYRTKFWDAAHRVIDAGDVEQKYEEVGFREEEKRMAYEMAASTRDYYANKVMTALARMHRNQEAIEEHANTIEKLGDEIEEALKSKPQDFWGMLMDIVDLAMDIGAIASGSVGGIKELASFVGSFGNDSSFGDMIATLKENPLASFGDIVEDAKAIESYADRLMGGLKDKDGKRASGINNIVSELKKVKEGAKGVDELRSQEGVQLAGIVAADLEMELDIRDALVDTYGALGMVQEMDAGIFTNKKEALGKMNLQIVLLNEMRDFNRESQFLTEEHLLAATELRLAAMGLAHAEIDHSNAKEMVRNMECRLGLRNGIIDCAGIPAGFDVDDASHYRDAMCQLAKDFDDTALMFDFLYERSKNYASLTTEEDVGARRTDYRKTLLDEENWTARDQQEVQEVWDELVAQLAPNVEHDVAGYICHAGTPCAKEMNGFSAEYAHAVLSGIQDHGIVQFSLDDACDELDDDGQCHAYLSYHEGPRQRVINFDTKLVMREGYRLGCDTVDGCAATRPPYDRPTKLDFKYLIEYSHGPLATFIVDNDNKEETFNFSNRHAKTLCELAANFAEVDKSCNDVVHFTGERWYRAPSENSLDGMGTISRNVESDPRMFGTSVRDTWEVDVRDTMVLLNSQAGDHCYRNMFGYFGCLPDECHENVGDPQLPSYCASMDNPLMPGHPMPRLFATCDSYVRGTQPRLMDSGDPDCCTSGGHFRDDLSADDAKTCNDLGWHEDSCTTPDDCYRICGEKCKAFKAAIDGIEFVIYYTN